MTLNFRWCELAGTNGDASFPAVKLKADICAKRQANMVALGAFEAKLPALDAGELLEHTMVDFDQPGTVGKRFPLRRGGQPRPHDRDGDERARA